jgi:hypothetical protein
MPLTNRHRHGLPSALIAVSCGLVIAACGSAGSSAGASTSGTPNAGLKFAECMRSHDVPNFPDPGASGGGFHPMAGVNPSSPAFQSANTACNKLLGTNGSPQAPTAAEKAAALTFAKCMRTHGVPNFPDPTLSATGRGETLILHGLVFAVGSGLNPQSPAFKQAAAACGLRIP